MTPSHRFSRLSTTLLLFTGLSLFTAGTASAGLPSPLELHREVRGHVSDVLRGLGRVPDHIERAHERHLQAFFGGREYYGPHRHYHEAYQFPVWVDGDVQYRPYSYCGGRLFGSVSVRPNLWIDWSLDDGGFFCDHCHGYFPRQHGHFRQTYPRQRYYHYDDRSRYNNRGYDHRDRRRDDHRHDSRRDRYRRDDHRNDRHDRGDHRDHRNDRYDRDDHRNDRYDRGDRRDRGRNDRRGHGRRGNDNQRRGHRGGGN
jgi:hypothetical protein